MGTKANVIDQASDKTALKEGTNPVNYEISYLDGTLTVTARSGLTVEAAPYEGVYDGEFHNITYTVKINDEVCEDAAVYFRESGTTDWIPVSEFEPYKNAMAAKTVEVKAEKTNYESATDSATVTITKATPYIKTAPEPSDIFYGKTLNDSTLFGGYVQFSETNSSQVGGLFEWTSGNTVPAVADSETTSYSVTFTPADEDNFNSVTCMVTLTVGAAKLIKPEAAAKTYTYDGNKQYFELVGFDANTMVISGNEQTSANETGYTVTVMPKDNYVWSTDGDCTFTWVIAKAAENAPESGEGYVLDYAAETMTAESGYELSTSDSDIAAAIPDNKVVPGETYFVRKLAANENYEDSEWVEITLPARPAAPASIEAVQEEFIHDDAYLRNLDETMEYMTSSDGVTYYGWYACPEGMSSIAIGLSNVTPVIEKAYYQVRSKATSEAFASEAAEFEFTAATIYKFVIDGNGYDWLEDSVAAVNDNEEIVLNTDAADQGTIEISREVTFTINLNGNDMSGTEIKAGSGYALVSSGTDLVTYTVTESHTGSTSAPTINVPVSGDENSLNVKATVSGKTASIQPISNSEIQKVIGSDEGSGMLSIDLCGTNKTITGAKIPTATVEKIGEQAGMSVKLTTATVAFDKTATQEISDQAKGNTVELVVDDIKEVSLNAVQKEAVQKLDTALIIDAYLVSGGTKLCTEGKGGFNGGKATVMLPYAIKNNRTAANYSVYYVDDAGKLEKLATKYDVKLGAFVFDITHFSNYVVAYDENACLQDATCVYAKFTDADVKAWYHDGVHYCLDNGIMAGFPGDLFKPNGITTRAQIAQILYNLEGQPAFMNDNVFTDVVSGSWYEKAVVWAQGKGVVNGYPDGTFKPDDSITREQLAVILYNYAKYKEIDVTVDENTNFLSFNDFWDTSEWAKPAMMWAIERELIVGTNWDLKPQGDAVRAQAATIIWKFCETVVK